MLLEYIAHCININKWDLINTFFYIIHYFNVYINILFPSEITKSVIGISVYNITGLNSITMPRGSRI